MHELFAYCVVVFLLAGLVKGVAGMGLPTASIAMLSQITDPRSAVAIAVISIIGSNIWQMLRGGQVLRTVRRYFPFVFMLCLFILLSSVYSASLSHEAVLLIVGCAIVLFVLDAFWRTPVPYKAHLDRWIQMVAGALGGIIGGISGLWTPSVVGYLLARQVDKDEFVRGVAFMVFAGGVFLLLGTVRNGYMTAELLPLSLLMVIPSIIGFAVGERLRSRINEARYRKLVLWLFLILGANLIRRALWS